MQELAEKIFTSVVEYLGANGAIKRKNVPAQAPEIITSDLKVWSKEFFDYFVWLAIEVHRHHNASSWMQCDHYICLSIRGSFNHHGMDPRAHGWIKVSIDGKKESV